MTTTHRVKIKGYKTDRLLHKDLEKERNFVTYLEVLSPRRLAGCTSMKNESLMIPLILQILAFNLWTHVKMPLFCLYFYILSCLMLSAGEGW